MAHDDPANSRYHSKVQATTRQTAQFLLLKPALIKLLKIHVHGVSNLRGLHGAFAVFGNHSSHLDAPLILCSMPGRLSKYVATGAAGDFFFGNWVKSVSMSLFMNAFAIDRGRGGKGRRGMASHLLSQGVPIMLFPEGTRSRTGAMGPFIPGVASLCISRGVPAVPVALVGAYAAWPSKQKHLPKGRPEVHVVFGRPMTPYQGEIAHEFNERMRRQVLELHDTTARAYGMKTLEEYARTDALEKAGKSEIATLVEDAKEQADKQEDR